MPDAGKLFDDYYYAHGCNTPYRRDEGWLAQFGRIADAIVREIQPQTVLDVGCAIGLLVETLRERGVEAYGVDVSEYAIEQVHPAVRAYCTIGEATEPFGRRYDLITCIEVLEHMAPEQAQPAIENLCAHADRVLFSSSPFDYAEVTHFNVQPPEYWAQLFAQQNFFRDVDLNAGFLTPWAACFRRQDKPVAQVAADYERSFWHMRQESQTRLKVNLEQREQMAEQEAQLQMLSQELASRESNWQAQIEQARKENAALRDRLAAIDDSTGGRILHRLQSLRGRLAPPGSKRDQALERILRILLGT
jgi:SAM-dependent methyltransferase